MSLPSPDSNLQRYEAREVVAHYAALDYLTPCERLLFETYIAPCSTILDLGVGGGRTAAYLAHRASRYVGVDYAPSMVNACRERFPTLDFVVGDAADLSGFPDASFDIVVFAFNGMDYVLPGERRQKCVANVHRLLKPGGRFIFSSHNPRSVVIRPNWNRDRLRRIARKFAEGSRVLYALWLAGLTTAHFMWACIQAIGTTASRALKRIPTRMFWHGEGTLMDSVHGGLLTHYWTPREVVRVLSDWFQVECVLGNDYPHSGHGFVTDWYYYVFTKPCKK